MIDQRVEPKRLKGWRGAALVAAIVAAAALGSRAFAALARFIGGAATVLFFAYGAAIAWVVLRRCVLGFRYVFDGSCLKLSRTYGRYERPMATLWLNGIAACDTPETLRARFPGSRVQRAVRADCETTPLAVAYRSDGKTAIWVLQPEDDLREALRQTVKRKR